MMNLQASNEQSSGQTLALEDGLFLFGGHFLFRISTPVIRYRPEYKIAVPHQTDLVFFLSFQSKTPSELAFLFFPFMYDGKNEMSHLL